MDQVRNQLPPIIRQVRQQAEAGLEKVVSCKMRAMMSNEKADLPPTEACQPRSGTETTNGG